MKFCRSPRDACGIYLPRMHVIAHILLPQAAALLMSIVVGSRLLLRVYFLCLVSCASPHLRQDCAVPLKHANPSCIKFSFFAVLASCRTLSCLYIASRRRLILQPHLSCIHTALAANFSACALNFSLKALFGAASEQK